MAADRIDVLKVLDAEVDTIHRLQEWVNEALAPTKLTAEEAIERLVEARAAVAEIQAAGKRVTAAFRAIGNFPAPVATTAMRAEAEAAMVALDKALSRMEPQS